MNNKVGIIFDMDGTLLESMHIWINLYTDLLKKFGISSNENIYDIASKMSLPEIAEYMVRKHSIKKTPKEVLSIIHDYIENFYFNEVNTKEKAKEVLEYFNDKNVPMSVATLTNKKYTLGALDHNEITQFFNPILTCREVGHYKTEPNIYLECAKIMGTQVQNTYVVEDTLYALKTANKAGFITVGIYDVNAEPDREEIKKEAKFYIKNLSELKEVIK